MKLTSYARYQPRENGRFIEAVITSAVRDAVLEIAGNVLDRARELVPVDTGELMESGHLVVAETGKSITAAVEFDADHSVFVEYGTGLRGAASPGAGDGPYSAVSGMPAQPYLRPAWEEYRGSAGLVREKVAAALR